MQLQTHTWEHALLSLANEARYASGLESRLTVDAKLLAEAYRHCAAITAEHSRSFYLASALLSAPKRQAVRALYAFCRTTDDIVDNGDANRSERLAAWRQQALGHTPPVRDPVILAWTDTRMRYNVPTRYAEQLIDGVAQDLVVTRYQTFNELVAYCYGVASTVGLMSMHIVGFTSQQAIPYAIKLGVALQLTNILRDVAEDWRAGRVYLPADDLAEYNLDEAAIAHGIASGQISDRWRAFMQAQIKRTRRLYAEATPGLALLAPDGRQAIAAAADLYRAILDDIEAHDYDVFTRRAHVSTWGKLKRLPALWLRYRA